MEFTIFRKTGEIRTVNGWDGDEGYDVEVDVSDDKVREDVFKILCEEYRSHFLGFGALERAAMKHFARNIIEDNDLWGAIIDNHRVELRDKYEEELC